eukprot:scaffold7903_cov90-Isochrysis_galbana.AAC.1
MAMFDHILHTNLPRAGAHLLRTNDASRKRVRKGQLMFVRHRDVQRKDILLFNVKTFGGDNGSKVPLTLEALHALADASPQYPVPNPLPADYRATTARATAKEKGKGGDVAGSGRNGAARGLAAVGRGRGKGAQLLDGHRWLWQRCNESDSAPSEREHERDSSERRRARRRRGGIWKARWPIRGVGGQGGE